MFRVRDVTMYEDCCLVRPCSVPETMAELYNLVISLLRMERVPDITAALSRCATRPSHPLSLVGAPIP